MTWEHIIFIINLASIHIQYYSIHDDIVGRALVEHLTNKAKKVYKSRLCLME